MYSLKDVKLINFETFYKKRRLITLAFKPTREILTAYTSNDNVPFNLKRMFLIGNVKKNSLRGSHAHKKTKQIFICFDGTIHVRCFDGKKSKIFKLKDQSLGLFIPPTIWYDILYKGKKNTIMVFTDKKYSISDYIETKIEYLNFIKKNESF